MMNDEQRCRTCKWWGRYYTNVCDFVTTTMAENPQTKFVIDAFANDDQGLEAMLVTGPDFGCIHWQQSEDEQEEGDDETE